MWTKSFEKMVSRLMRTGTLILNMPDGEVLKLGDGTAPEVTVTLHDPKLPRKLMLNPELSLGEAYMDETLTIKNDDLRGMLCLVIRNNEDGNLPKLQNAIRAFHVGLRKWTQWNTHRAALKNSKHHYEITTEFYNLFLDPDHQYTCAYFRGATESLEQAQANKIEHIAKKLLLSPGMRVLDIGCGWGGLAIALARDYDARVVGVSLSEEQLATARQRAIEEGVADKIDFRLMDYRNVDETFDRIVSVGMLEHVGQPQYGTYFKQVEQNLAEDGVSLIHFIGRTSQPTDLSPWFRKYIFPGGYSPALSEVLREVEKTKLQQADIEVWRTHYERTLIEWQNRFEARLPEVRALGYDDRFIRMWRYYLIASELSMSDMPLVLFQLQLAKHQNVVPATRDYLYAPQPKAKAKLQAAE